MTSKLRLPERFLKPGDLAYIDVGGEHHWHLVLSIEPQGCLLVTFTITWLDLAINEKITYRINQGGIDERWFLGLQFYRDGKQYQLVIPWADWNAL